MPLHTWLSTSFNRHFPRSPAQRPHPLRIDAALNEQISFQAVMRQDDGEPQTVRAEVGVPHGWSARLRRVGFVPLQHHNTPADGIRDDIEGRGHIPGYVPDPLFEENSVLLPVAETHAFWLTIQPGLGAKPGFHTLTVTIIPEKGKKVVHRPVIHLHDIVLEPRRNFHITHWLYVDALIDWYRTDLFDRRFWAILSGYLRNLSTHGQNVIYVPVFTPPLDGVKRPSQLLHVRRTGPDHYRFDWQDVRKFIRLARQCGFTHFEWCHLFTQWGVKHAVQVYDGQGRDGKLLWRPTTGATSPTYRRFLGKFLPELHRFLDAEGVFDNSFFHVSDEPHGAEHLENYRKARGLLREVAPWMRVMDALSEIEFGRQQLTDLPIPSIKTALDFHRERIPSWCYYCCGPRGKYLNRLMDTPLAKIAMHGFLFYRWPFGGFLHWGYNYWYRSQTRELIDPFSAQDGGKWPGWAYGDTFAVYPGPNGPLDSIRWEIFGESLQNYRLLQTLGIDRNHPLLSPLRSFSNFPKAEKWHCQARTWLLSNRKRPQLPLP